MQVPTFAIALILCISVLLISIFTSVYEEKKDTKMIAGIVTGVIMSLVGIGLSFMNNKIAGAIITVGILVLVTCAYFHNKNNCDSSVSVNVKRGLLGGIITGASIVSIGLVLTKPEVSSFISNSIAPLVTSSSSSSTIPTRHVNLRV